jgi:hypothetical protein
MNNPRRLKRILSEGSVIVLSILLAFWIDAWWNNRQALKEEMAILESVRGELDRNRGELDTLLDRTKRDLDRIDRFFRATPPELVSLPPDSVNPWLLAAAVPWTFDPELSAASVLLEESPMASDRGRASRETVARWMRLLEDTHEEKASLTEYGNAVLGQLASGAAGTASQGLALIDQMATRMGPAILAQLRGDPDFIAAVMSKSHQQMLYLSELTEASSALDAVRAVLEMESGRGGARDQL